MRSIDEEGEDIRQGEEMSLGIYCKAAIYHLKMRPQHGSVLRLDSIVFTSASRPLHP